MLCFASQISVRFRCLSEVQRRHRQAVIESTEQSVIRNKRSTQIDRLIYDRLIIVVITVQLINERQNSRGIHDTRDGKLQIAKRRIWRINDLTIISFAKNNFVSIFETHRSCIRIADHTEDVFVLLRENSEGMTYEK